MYEIPRGLTFVKTDGTIKYFCSSKCIKNFKLGRKDVKWVSKAKHNVHEELVEQAQNTKE